MGSETYAFHASGRVDRITGGAMPLRGDDIDTDRIIPARFLKAISFEGLERHVFEDDRREAAGRGSTHVFEDPRYANAVILIVNANFGCGSSREHAPQAIHRRGIAAIVGESFSDIFFGNALALGMPCPTASRDALQALQNLVEREPGTVLDLDLDAMTVRAGDAAFPISLPAAARQALRDGTWDATGLLLENFEEVRAVAARLPYVSARW